MPSDARKSLEYAEQRLGVNSTYEVLMESRNQLDKNLTRLAEVKDTKRDVETAIDDRQMDMTLQETSAHPGMSVAAMERHLKQAFHTDTELSDLRIKLSAAISEIEGVNYDVQILETDIRIGVARLTELGGYLNYLAVLKSQHS